MLKRELKVNRKSLIIWSMVTMALFLIVYLVYPSIMNGENATMMNKMLETMPKEMLKAFNMDISGMENAYGWFKTEGYIFLLLIFGMYAAIMGSTILLKEESEHTIEFLYSKPVSRNKIVNSRVFTGLINILILVISVTIFNIIGMYFSGILELKELLLLSLVPILTILPLFLISMMISTFFRKTKHTIAIGIALVFVSYFIQMVSTMATQVEWLKYFSLFTLTDARNIITTGNVNVFYIITSVILSSVSYLIIRYRYNNKELV